jgi:hypothetical protein
MYGAMIDIRPVAKPAKMPAGSHPLLRGKDVPLIPGFMFILAYRKIVQFITRKCFSSR